MYIYAYGDGNTLLGKPLNQGPHFLCYRKMCWQEDRYMANVFLNTAICQAQILAGLDSQTLSYLCHPHLYCCLFPKSSGTCRTLRGRVSLSMCAGLGDMGNRVRDSLCHSGSLRWATTSSSVQNGIFLKVWRPLGKLETVRMSFPALPEPP